MSDSVTPRYIAGSIAPLGPDRHPMPQPEPLLPPDVRRISCSIQISDYTKSGVDEAIDNRYWACVEELATKGANSISLSGFPIASKLGRPRVLELISKTAERTGAFADAQSEASVDAMRNLGMRRIAIASRWSHELNEKLIAYLASAYSVEKLIFRGHEKSIAVYETRQLASGWGIPTRADSQRSARERRTTRCRDRILDHVRMKREIDDAASSSFSTE